MTDEEIKRHVESRINVHENNQGHVDNWGLLIGSLLIVIISVGTTILVLHFSGLIA